MMQRLCAARPAALLSLILFLGLAIGCETPDRFMTDPDARNGGTAARETDAAEDDGGFNLFDFSPDPINAGKVVVVRRMGGSASTRGTLTRPDDGQLLSINLFNGSAVFEDTDGQRYPTQIGLQATSELRRRVNAREWESASRSASAGPQAYAYSMQAYVNGEPHKTIVSWTESSATEHPLLASLTDHLIRQHRRAHPLSDDVNILLDEER